MLKIILLRNLQTLRANNSRTLRIENVKFSGHCFYININIYRDFQICISVLLSKLEQVIMDFLISLLQKLIGCS